mmetsp:Transcript_65029/g.193872  ORF Transcript_65029/g.193872 Transcript_65029/m.193872 type:complete len:213 (-) Transcript_65029:537-1175(-)
MTFLSRSTVDSPWKVRQHMPSGPASTFTGAAASPRSSERSPKWPPRVSVASCSVLVSPSTTSLWLTIALPEATMYHRRVSRTRPWCKTRSPGWQSTKPVALHASSQRSELRSGANRATSSSSLQMSPNRRPLRLKAAVKWRRCITYRTQFVRALNVACMCKLYKMDSSPKLSPLVSSVSVEVASGRSTSSMGTTPAPLLAVLNRSISLLLRE